MKPQEPGAQPVITRLSGGLGNQIFQYAAGKAVAVRAGIPLLVDARDCYEHHGYELERVFARVSGQATLADIRRLLGWRPRKKVLRLLRSLPPLLRGRYVPERHYQYWEGFREIARASYLDGFWQSELYFKDIEAELRTDLAFRLPLTGPNAEVASLIAAVAPSVSLHVRRGDYVSDPSLAASHGALERSYYERAIEVLRNAVPQKLTVFVFSDDVAWAEENLRLPTDTRYVGHNRGADSHFDMQLMSRCSHHIIANSSFSWWAAWLNPRPDKIVIAPARWFPTPEPDTSTVTPPSWMRI